MVTCTEPNIKPQPIMLWGRKRAEVTPNGILDRFNFHILRKPEPSIGYDVALLDEAERMGATIASNRDLQNGITYSAPISRVREHGFAVDHGWGKQIALPLRLWDKTDTDGYVQAAQPVQGGLFAEVAS